MYRQYVIPPPTRSQTLSEYSYNRELHSGWIASAFSPPNKIAPFFSIRLVLTVVFASAILNNGSTSEWTATLGCIDSREPQTRAERPWGSSGDGAECAICAHAIGPDELGYELQFPRSESKEAVRCCQVHARCLKAWDAVRTEPKTDGP
jgi:hypothetical protein